MKSFNRNKPAYTNELVKALNSNDPCIEEIGLNEMTYMHKSLTCNESMHNSNGYPIICFLKYVIDDNKPIQEAKQFRMNVTELLNSFNYKYKTEFEYGGDVSPDKMDIAAHCLLTRDIHK